MKQDPYWFFKKWGMIMDPVPTDEIYDRLSELEQKVKKLEEENIETTNTLYELMNSLDAVDARIDIVTGEKWIKGNV